MINASGRRISEIDWKKALFKWWFSIFLIPFIFFHLHQAYWTIRFNIFFSISYDFPFPINIENFFIRNFLLLVHEAGHTFFGLLGNRTVTILGGSLNEILLTSLILGYFWFHKIQRGTQFGFYLLGSAWLSVAFYAADGSARQLPLIGNLGKESHDWHNLLYQWNLLNFDKTIAILFVCLGAGCFLLSVTVPLWLKKYEDVKIKLKL